MMEDVFMFKKKTLKVAFVLFCLITLIMPHFSTVLAILTSTRGEQAQLKLASVRGSFAYTMGGIGDNNDGTHGLKIFQIITDSPITSSHLENEIYCIDRKKSFPPGTYTYTNVADLSDKSDSTVQQQKFNTERSADAQTWETYHDYLINLFNIIYLSKRAPEQKDQFLAKAFAFETKENKK